MKTPRGRIREHVEIAQRKGATDEGVNLLTIMRDPDQSDVFGNDELVQWEGTGSINILSGSGVQATVYLQDGDIDEHVSFSPRAISVRADSANTDEPEAFFIGGTFGSLPNPTLGLYKKGMLKISGLAPADGEINNGSLFLYFDPTNGAGKLLLKGKTANGTVVTGQVALT